VTRHRRSARQISISSPVGRAGEALSVNGGGVVPRPPEALRHAFAEVLVELEIHEASAPASSM
jgi:hypothetical protein